MTKRRRAGSSKRSASVSRWLSLPEDVRLRVLAHLNAEELMTARLVCRHWRVTCLACVKSARPCRWPDFERASLERQRTMLESSLQLLTALTAIFLYISKSRDAALLNVPGSSAIKKGIDVDFNSVIHQGPHRRKAQLAADLAPLTSLTGLTSFTAESVFDAPGPRAPLRSLFLDFGIQILQQCTQLRVVKLICTPSEWMQLLPHLAGLPHLELLEDVPIGEDAVLEGVAALTQVTGLRLSGEVIPDSIMCLTAMPALKHLCLDTTPVRALMQAAPALTQLKMLIMELGRRVAMPQLEAILTPMRGLTQLQVIRKGEGVMVAPQRLFHDTLTELEALAWNGLTIRGASWHLSRKLFHLSLSAPKKDGRKLLEELAALTRLQWLQLAALTLELLNPPKRWSTAAKYNEAWRAATFLTGLTGLTCLHLLDVLHADNMEENVRCIAALTELMDLGLHGKYLCHGMRSDSDSEDDWLTAAMKRAPEAVQEEGNCPKSVQAFERRGGFLQLLSLRSLNYMTVSGPWTAIDESGFPEALNHVRHEMGRPPVEVTDNNDLFG